MLKVASGQSEVVYLRHTRLVVSSQCWENGQNTPKNTLEKRTNL